MNLKYKLGDYLTSIEEYYPYDWKLLFDVKSNYCKSRSRSRFKSRSRFESSNRLCKSARSQSRELKGNSTQLESGVTELEHIFYLFRITESESLQNQANLSQNRLKDGRLPGGTQSQVGNRCWAMRIQSQSRLGAKPPSYVLVRVGWTNLVQLQWRKICEPRPCRSSIGSVIRYYCRRQRQILDSCYAISFNTKNKIFSCHFHS